MSGIGVLRAVGFGTRTIVTTFLPESLFLGLPGGFAGVACGSLLQWIAISTINWGTFSELALTFRLTPGMRPCEVTVVPSYRRLEQSPKRGYADARERSAPDARPNVSDFLSHGGVRVISLGKRANP